RRRHTRSKRDWSSDVCSSDLFLMPPIWLVLGAIWIDYRPGPGAGLSPGIARGLLLLLVVLMGSFNVVDKLWPEARSSRELEGLRSEERRVGKEGKAGRGLVTD